jgi:hypothetical protein
MLINSWCQQTWRQYDLLVLKQSNQDMASKLRRTIVDIDKVWPSNVLLHSLFRFDGHYTSSIHPTSRTYSLKFIIVSIDPNLDQYRQCCFSCTVVCYYMAHLPATTLECLLSTVSTAYMSLSYLVPSLILAFPVNCAERSLWRAVYDMDPTFQACVP